MDNLCRLQLTVFCIMAAYLFTSCLCFTDNEHHELTKTDCIRVGQCILGCKEERKLCYDTCVLNAEKGLLDKFYNGSDVINEMWEFPEPGVKVELISPYTSIITYPYPESVISRAKSDENTTEPLFLFMIISENEVSGLWDIITWTNETKILISRYALPKQFLILAISSEHGLIVEEKYRDYTVGMTYVIIALLFGLFGPCVCWICAIICHHCFVSYEAKKIEQEARKKIEEKRKKIADMYRDHASYM